MTDWRKYRPYLIGAVGGVLVAAVVPLIGIIDFDASRGQWGATDWYFSVAARQSVTLRSVGMSVPDLHSEADPRRAAGHYELVCAACHGSPAGPPEALADDLVPPPPRLMEQMRNWRPDARVFWTVKHGIKRSAMPAWPSQLRDDEVWDMVAFLSVLPALSAAEYRMLAGADRAGCESCHGEGGKGGPAAPRLDIQSPDYLAGALEAFRQGSRASGTMQAVAAQLSNDEIVQFAERFGTEAETEPAAGAGLGAEIAARGIPARDIAACDSCHSGQRPDYPRLQGQDRDYLQTQLELFNEHGASRGGPHAQIMAHAIRRLPLPETGPLLPEEIEALADHYGVRLD